MILHTTTGNKQISEHLGDNLGSHPLEVKHKSILVLVLNIPLFWAPIPTILTINKHAYVYL